MGRSGQQNIAGSEYAATDSGGSTYRDLSSLSFPLAVPSSISDKVILPLTDHTTAQNFFAPDYVSPYVQTFTMSVTRSLPGSLVLDVRYVGTRGVKLHSSINYNEPDFQNNGLLQALTITRSGGNAPIFDQMFNGLNFGAGIGVVGQNGVTGSEALRRHASFRTDIANGNFQSCGKHAEHREYRRHCPRGSDHCGRNAAVQRIVPGEFHHGQSAVWSHGDAG